MSNYIARDECATQAEPNQANRLDESNTHTNNPCVTVFSDVIQGNARLRVHVSYGCGDCVRAFSSSNEANPLLFCPHIAPLPILEEEGITIATYATGGIEPDILSLAIDAFETGMESQQVPNETIDRHLYPLVDAFHLATNQRRCQAGYSPVARDRKFKKAKTALESSSSITAPRLVYCQGDIALSHSDFPSNANTVIPTAISTELSTLLASEYFCSLEDVFSAPRPLL